jgi:XTP/dITP diphosphohydrolase
VKTELLYVTNNRDAFDEAAQFFERHAPSINLVYTPPRNHELQSLDERQVIEHKAINAWHAYKQPLIVEDSGFYFKRYNTFPGTLSEFALTGLARGGLNKLCQVDSEATAFAWLGYVTQENAACFFNDTTDGYVIADEAPLEQTALDLYTVFHPQGAPQTLAGMFGTEQSERFSHRLKTLGKFLTWFQAQEGE